MRHAMHVPRDFVPRFRAGVSRRDFLASIIGAGWTGLSLLEGGLVRAALARAQAPAAPANLFDIEKVADGIYVALARPTAMINCNAAIFVNAGDVVVVDTHSKPSAAAALIAQIGKQVTAKPVRYVVNSHFHWDHAQGNSAYKKAFPKVDFIATEATRKLMAAETKPRLAKVLEGLPGEIEKSRSAASRAKSAVEREFYRKLAADQEAYGREMRAFTLELPTVTLDRTLILHDRAGTLEFSFHGRGHTAGDVVLLAREKRVIATGDLVHGFLPYIADGFPREWPGTIDAVGQLPFDTVIGGHGTVHRDRVRFTGMRNYLEELTAKVDEGKRAGKSAADLEKTITPTSLRSLQTDKYGTLVRDALKRFTPNLGEPPFEEAVRSNIRDVFATIDKK